MHVQVCIIGGGIAGLRVAEILTENGEDSLLLLESREQCGGRIKSRYDENESLMYETGPWRIPSVHRRAIWLFHWHDIPLQPLLTPPVRKNTVKSVCPGLSIYDLNLMKTSNPHKADRLDQETGYAGETESDSSSVPYTLEDDVRSPNTSFLVAPGGFSSLVQAMERRIGEEKILRDTRVADVRRNLDGTYSVRCVRRHGEAKMRFDEYLIHAEEVFVCTPPHVAREWPSFAQSMKTFLSRVEAGCLHHVYMKGDPVPGQKIHEINANSPLVQTISDQYESGWFQASYSGGRIARFWHHLRMTDPALFLRFIMKCVRSSFPRARLVRGGKLTPESPDPSDVVASHFWESAYHAWRPVPFFNVDKAVLSSVHPNPVFHPNLFWAGEAFSSHQAWIEGALQTASLATQARMQGGVKDFPHRKRKEGEMVAEGRILDISLWKERHPGGGQALVNHLKEEDICRTMTHIGHSDNAWATVSSLQIAWEA